MDEPIYEYAKYDTFELRSGASSADGKNLEKVTHQRIVKVIGTNKVDRWVPDPNGTNIVIWVQPTTWQPGFLGQNGLALYTVLKAGVPETQPVLAKHVETMCRYLQTYGLPDGTFDLAWLTAAKVKEYACAGSGLLLVDIAGGAVNNLAAVLNDAKLRNVPDAEPFWADFKGTRPKLQGLYTADNRLVAVFLPVAQVAAPESAELLAAQAVQVTQLAIEKQAPAGYFAADYPIRCSGDVNPYEARVTALHALATAPTL